PLIKPILSVVMLFSIIFTFADFEIVYVLTRGGPTNSTHLFATLAYQTGLASSKLGEGAAIALFLLPVLVLSVIVQLHVVRVETDFLIWMQNSFMVAALVTFISVSIGIMAGYSLARLRYRGAETIGASVFITYLVPPSLLFLPLSHVIGQLGLMETRWAMVISYPTFLVPFCTWLLMGYFRTIPKEIEECALVDGCTRIKALLRIVLPVAIPGIITAALFSFTLAWGEYLYSITFVTDSYEKTIPSAVVGELIRGDVYHWGGLMA